MAIHPGGTVTTPTMRSGHPLWVRICHWIVVLAFLSLMISGTFIFAVHPRLYWGEVGNDLTPALLEIPITENHQADGWQRSVSYPIGKGDVFTAIRTYPIFNQNAWARSLHFLSAWLLITAGLIYFVTSLVTGHARKNLVPPLQDLRSGAPLKEAGNYLRGKFGDSGGGRPYGSLQRLTYSVVIFVMFPLIILTGMTMSPAMTATFPFLLDVFGGFQSARTIHFFTFALLVLFLLVHVMMVILTGPGRQLRTMTLGGHNEQQG